MTRHYDNYIVYGQHDDNPITRENSEVVAQVLGLELVGVRIRRNEMASFIFSGQQVEGGNPSRSFMTLNISHDAIRVVTDAVEMNRCEMPGFKSDNAPSFIANTIGQKLVAAWFSDDARPTRSHTGAMEFALLWDNDLVTMVYSDPEQNTLRIDALGNISNALEQLKDATICIALRLVGDAL